MLHKLKGSPRGKNGKSYRNDRNAGRRYLTDRDGKRLRKSDVAPGVKDGGKGSLVGAIKGQVLGDTPVFEGNYVKGSVKGKLYASAWGGFGMDAEIPIAEWDVEKGFEMGFDEIRAEAGIRWRAELRVGIEVTGTVKVGLRLA